MSENLPGPVLVRPLKWGESVGEGGFVVPSGTVTLVLGDVEGSTRAWEADAEATRQAILKLNELVDEVVGRFDGVRPVEQGEGDSFVAAFGRARDGVGCALELQQRLADGSLRVRVGVHTGDIVRRDAGNYLGPAIIRCARLRNLAHGGQTVVSEATRELVTDALPEGAELRDLGVHRLKDLSRPERVFQLCHPDLPGEYPPLRSLDARPHNLPVQRTTFIGREFEIAQLAELIAAERLITITGSGGCGKTRLALQVAAEVLEQFPDGVWFVDLSAVLDGPAVAAQVAHALAIPIGPGLTATQAVVSCLGPQRALVVLDNCEQVCDAAAAVADAVAAGCIGTHVVATSRQPLSVAGEICWRVPSLSLPVDDGPAGIEGLSRSESVQLFADRAARARPGLVLDERSRQAVTDICRRLDGIPLAIELAAARVRVLTPAQIADGLSERFRLLTGAVRTALPRQQTLEASLDWSHTLLTEPERIAFRRLAVFAGAFDLDAASAVCAGNGIEPWQVLDLLSLLVDKCLVVVEDDAVTARYRLLETMRLYANDRLLSSEEHQATCARHYEHYLTRAESATPMIMAGDAAAIIARLSPEYPNLTAALMWCRDQGHNDRLCRLVVALSAYWLMGVSLLNLPVDECVVWIDDVLADEALASDVRANLLWMRASLAYIDLDVERMARLGEEGLAIARRVGLDGLAGRFLGILAQAQGYGKDTRALLDEGNALCGGASDTFGQVFVQSGLAVHSLLRDPAASRTAFTEALALGTNFGTAWITGAAVAALGWVTLLTDGPAAAIHRLDDARLTEVGWGGGLGLVAALGFRAVSCAAADMPTEALANADEMAEFGRRLGVRREFLERQARALVAAAAGDFGGAITQARGALAAAVGTTFVAAVMGTAARVELAAGDVAAARQHTDELLRLSETEGFVVTAAEGRVLDARLLRREGDRRAAEDAAHTALRLAGSASAMMTVVDALEELAGLVADDCGWEEAGRLLGAAASLREASGYKLCLTDRDTDLARLRDTLGNNRLEAALAEGASLSVDEAIIYAARGRGERKRPVAGWASLTAMELQIVELVQGGRTNAEIGNQLFVSARTIQTHLTRIYRKLGVASRTELAARAAARP
jgi:predicted ATPase/class 3 adenylate cyclase/DNA-binding CsgD family transcriptional regulator